MLVTGDMAGVPAVFLKNPAEVMKSRHQVISLEGEMIYLGLLGCATKILKYEGVNAFFKGSGIVLLNIVFRNSIDKATTCTLNK